MNELTRYDHEIKQQLQEISVPSEDIAWIEMAKLLDKDDDPEVIPFFKKWGCLLLALLAGLLITAITYWYLGSHSESAESKAIRQEQVDQPIEKETSFNSLDIDSPIDTPHHSLETGIGSLVDSIRDRSGSPVHTATNDNHEADNTQKVKKGNTTVRTGQTTTTNIKLRTKNRGRKKTGQTKFSVKTKTADFSANAVENNNRSLTENDTSTAKNPTGSSPIATSEPMDTIANEAIRVTDSSAVKKTNRPKPQAEDASETSEKEAEKTRLNFAAGISIYQPLNLSGESSVPYNFYGRKGTLADYIPAPYLRVFRKKMYLHTEFRLGAPQYVKPFDYKKIVIDSTAVNYTTANFRLRKTYYQQIPLSLHYYIVPNLSVGAGVIFNRFKGALVDRNTYKRVSGQTDSLISSVLQKVRNESVFSRNHFQWSAEVNYNWKRWFLGARFSRDIDPFIIYNDLNSGNRTEKKLQAFNIYLRYDLWRSKNKEKE